MEDALTISHRLDCAVHALVEAKCTCGEINRVAHLLVCLHYEGALELYVEPEVTVDQVREALGLEVVPAREAMH